MKKYSWKQKIFWGFYVLAFVFIAYVFITAPEEATAATTNATEIALGMVDVPLTGWDESSLYDCVNSFNITVSEIRVEKGGIFGGHSEIYATNGKKYIARGDYLQSQFEVGKTYLITTEPVGELEEYLFHRAREITSVSYKGKEK